MVVLDPQLTVPASPTAAVLFPAISESSQRVHALVSRLQVIVGRAPTSSREDLLREFETLLPSIPHSSSRAEEFVISGILDQTLLRLCRALKVDLVRSEWPSPLNRDTFAVALQRLRQEVVHDSKPLRIRQFEHIVSRRLSEHGLTARDVAKDMNLSLCHLLHLLKRHTGSGFRAHLRMVRLARVRQLLHSTTLSVKEITAAAGYARTSNLDRHFRSVFGITPTDYRRQACGSGFHRYRGTHVR